MLSTSSNNYWITSNNNNNNNTIETMVKYIKSMDEFKGVVKASESKLVVIQFTVPWCRPSHLISPLLEKLAEDHPEVDFFKVDVDETDDVAAYCRISAMPTFHFYKSGEVKDQLQGANPTALEEKVKTLK
mmetsp:Transcript_18257/g.27869  ORF Transcript_18257/g.27869 Transcript_18257/m.27869 type:complete len:130 (+) Transcript_18257:148-537(+)